MSKHGNASKETKNRSHLYLPPEEEDAGEKEAYVSPSTPSKQPAHASSAQSPNAGMSGVSPKPKLSKSSESESSAPLEPASDGSEATATLREDQKAGSDEATGEVEMRRRHTFPTQQDTADDLGQSHHMYKHDRYKHDRYKPEIRKGNIFKRTGAKKASSDPIMPSLSQADFLAHLEEEMGDEYNPEEVRGILQSIESTDLIKLQSEVDAIDLRPRHHPELERPTSVFIELKGEGRRGVLEVPRVESTVDDSGKMTRRLTLPAQPHKLMLLKELFSSTPACEVTIEEAAGTVVLAGFPQAVEQTEGCFQEQLGLLVEDRRDFSKTLTSIFRSPLGRLYLSEVTTAHNDCKLHVGTSFLLCAGMDRNDVRRCLTKIESDVRKEPLVVAYISNQDLKRLRKQIEEEYLARLIYQDAVDGEVLLEGLGQDVDLAREFLLSQVKEHQKDSDVFLIKGQARAKCFKNCFAQQLSEIKAIIRENTGSMTERFEEDRFTLNYQVRRGKMEEVQMKLRIIKASILEDSLDLKQEFPDIVDQWLLLEGFRKTDVQTFQTTFELTMREQCYLEIAIPSKQWDNGACAEPLTTLRKQGAEPLAKTILNTVLGILTSAPFYKSIIIKNTLVSVISGDISTVKADVLVSPLGSDLNMRNTAVGKCFLTRFGAKVQKDLSRLTSSSGHNDVIETPLPRDQLPVCALYHVVLDKWGLPADTEHIKTLVKTCLALAEENRCKSIAFPLLGCGKKFKLPVATVIEATIEATMAALAKASTGTSLEELTFVLDSTRHAQSFAQQLELLTPVASPELPEMTSEPQEKGDWLQEQLASTMPEETRGVLLMAHLYGPSRDILGTARARLVQQIRQTFLCEDSIEHAALLHLSQYAIEEIRTTAHTESVIIIRPPTAGSCLRLKGEHQAIAKLKEVIEGKLLQLLDSPTTSSHPSPLLGRQFSYHLPAYWSAAANPTLLDEALQNRYKLVQVTDGECSAIANLVRATWNPKLGFTDLEAVGLRHTSIDIIGVERVENPTLYENYFNRRTALQRERSEAGGGCTSLGSISLSSGPVATTALLTPGNPLLRELNLDINEHYLFHGTQPENIQAIMNFGPDVRLARAKGMLGSGIYFAESFTKSDRYADVRCRRKAGQKTVFLMRVLLGIPFINKDTWSSRYLRPPCRVCKKDLCRELHGGFFDSVIDDCPKRRSFRELIVYESALCYPEYVITYLRQG